MQTLSDPSDWYHVKSSENPADILVRRMNAHNGFLKKNLNVMYNSLIGKCVECIKSTSKFSFIIPKIG